MHKEDKNRENKIKKNDKKRRKTKQKQNVFIFYLYDEENVKKLN